MLGRFDLEETMEFGEAMWICPYCDCERILELDAEGTVECENCGREYEVLPVECMI